MTREAARLAFSDVRKLSDESEALNRIEEVDKERLARSRALRWSKRGMRADGTPWPRYTKRV